MGDPTAARPHVAVVVVNWNNAPDTLICLAALREHDRAVDVVVVDNGSDDGSADVIARHAPWVTLLRSTVNEGFTGGVNRGLRYALAGAYDAVALLNSDAFLVDAGLTRLARRACSSSHPVALAPQIVSADDGQVWFAGGVINNGSPRHLQAAEVRGRPLGPHTSQWLTGCCLVASMAVWDRVGLLDDKYFLFFEDCDWSARARDAGVGLLVDTSVVVRHGGSRSFRGPASMLGTYYHARNEIRYRRSHHLGGVLRCLRPVVTAPIRGRSGGEGQQLPAWPYGWIGALSGLLGAAGPAPSWLSRLAAASARRVALRQVKRGS